MNIYEYDQNLKLILPTNYIIDKDEDNYGNEKVRILSGLHKNEDGEMEFDFSCLITRVKYESEEPGEEISNINLLDLLISKIEDSKHIRIPGEPEIVLLSQKKSFSFFGENIKAFILIILVRVGDLEVAQFGTTGRINDEDSTDNIILYENMFEILKAIRINDKKLSLDGITPQSMQNALEFTFSEDDESIEISPQININLAEEDETTTKEDTSKVMKVSNEEGFVRVIPDESLYPHYKDVGFANRTSLYGADVIVNSSGTEYAFVPLRTFVEKPDDHDDFDKSIKTLYKKIIAKDTEKYELEKKAKEMQKLYHVNKNVFDCHHDRECELEEGLMHRAYMMSGLRSFAWTLADYCKQHDCTPEEIDYAIANRIVKFVANKDWLNYDDETYCVGLCSGSDINVFFIPDNVNKAERKKLLPSDDDIERINKIKQIFPTYREPLNEVNSLNELRNDLEYIYPAVKQLWNHLEKERNYDEALLGNEADIVYAWCALALAAKEPFFVEDGPMSCFFSQIVNRETKKIKREEDKKFEEKVAKAWLNKYKKHLEKDPNINFEGSTFVFSGLAGHSEEKEHPIVQSVILKGGKYRSKISGLTNYLIVNPAYAGESKVNAALEQLQKGKTISIVLLEDLEKVIDETIGNSNEKKSKSNVVKTAKKTIKKEPANGTSRKVTGTKVAKDSCDINSINVLTAYNGTAKNIILPEGIVEIGYGAFNENETITSVVIPEGVKTIGDCAFCGCTKLKKVVLPSTIQNIEDMAFGSCEELTSIVIPHGCKKIGNYCFMGCEKLKDIYVPSSVRTIGTLAFYTRNFLTMIHTPSGSVAEKVSQKEHYKFDNEEAPKVL